MMPFEITITSRFERFQHSEASFFVCFTELLYGLSQKENFEICAETFADE